MRKFLLACVQVLWYAECTEISEIAKQVKSTMANADSRLIKWLLNESGVSRYRISKDVGISESALSRIAKGETPMDAVRFGNASKLTDYARSVAPSSIISSIEADSNRDSKASDMKSPKGEERT
jgi:predicted transcriptional regulator